MLEQFSDPARRVVTLAEEEAAGLGHPHVGTEHLLLGLLEEDGTAAAEVLSSAGVTEAATRDKVVEAVGPSDPPSSGGQLQRTARAQRALDRAARFSRARGAGRVEPEDVLAGVLDVEGRAGQVLRGLGVDVGALGHAVKQRRDHQASGAAEVAVPAARPPLGSRRSPTAAGPAVTTARSPAPRAGSARTGSSAVTRSSSSVTGPAAPRCPHCHAGLAGGLSHRAVPSRDGTGPERVFVVASCPACGAVLGASPA